MSLNTDTTMQVVPAYGGYNGNCGNNGMFGNDWAWIVLFILFGGWGRGFGGQGGMMGGGCGAPCATQADVRAAVDQQTLISKLDQQTYGLADSTYALNNTIVNGFHGVDNAVCNLGYNVQAGFNQMGHQLSDCCCATQRAIDGVTFNIPKTSDGKDDFIKPWTFTSTDGRFEMDFIPVIDRASCTDVKLICSDQHQVFGKFTGKMVLDDGTVIRLKDFMGFAEKVHNKW